MESAYSNDPRVTRTDPLPGHGPAGFDEFRVKAGDWSSNLFVTVRIHRTDGWAIYEPSRFDGYSVAGFGSADAAIRYLIGDPQ